MYLTPFCQRERSADAFAFDMPSVEGGRVVAYGKGSGSFKALRIQASSVKCTPFRAGKVSGSFKASFASRAHRKMYLTPFCCGRRSVA